MSVDCEALNDWLCGLLLSLGAVGSVFLDVPLSVLVEEVLVSLVPLLVEVPSLPDVVVSLVLPVPVVAG